MPTYIALLRTVNVGGTGKLAMDDLRALCEAAGLERPRTYIASGDVVFGAAVPEKVVKARLEAALAGAGSPTTVFVRTAEEMAEIHAANPFPDSPAKFTVAIFLDHPPPRDALDFLRGHNGERVALGAREFYVDYGPGMGRSKLAIPAAKAGTARNMNTIAKLLELAADP